VCLARLGRTEAVRGPRYASDVARPGASQVTDADADVDAGS